MQVKSIKLLTGEELICEVVAETGQGYKIKTPLVVHAMRGADGLPAIGFVKWSFIQEDRATIHIMRHSIVSEPVEVVGAVEQSYIVEATGLVMPTKPGIVLQG